MGKYGTLVISIDLELAWGFNRELLMGVTGIERYFDSMRRVRKIIEPLLATLERYETPITWAVVGHLFLDRCEGHPDMPRIHVKRIGKGWYHNDPCTDIKNSPLWYGKDIIEKIVSSKVSHEIASHSFSHVDFSDPRCTPEIATAEAEKSLSVMKEFGVRPVSFVFPYDKVNHLDILRRMGFRVFRGPIHDQIEIFKSNRLLYKLLRKIRPDRPPIVNPEFSHGLLGVPGCMFFKAEQHHTAKYVEKKAEEALRRTVRHEKILHVFMHGRDLAGNKELLQAFYSFIMHSDKLRMMGRLNILTLKDLADKVINHLCTQS